jgi:HlyD family secretion protein
MSATQTKQPRRRLFRFRTAVSATTAAATPPRGRLRRWLIALIVVTGLVVLGFGLKALMSDTSTANESLVYYTARRSVLPIVVTERGNLESQVTEQIICEVESFGGDRMGITGTQIISIVPNGSSVKKGDLLVELDAAPLKDRLDLQFLALQRTEAEMIQATSKYDNQKTQNMTNLAEAELAVQLTNIDVNSYEDDTGGTYQIELQNIAMEIQNARAAQLIKQSDYDAVKLLYDLGYKSKGELSKARLDLLKADSALASQLAKSRQLKVYTYNAEKLNRKGKHETAVKNQEQVKKNNESELAQTLATKENADAAYKKEKERYERYTAQLGKCKIYAPQDGMVAYATEEGRWNRGAVIEEGAFVRERQEILSLPNLTRMQVSMAVHESVLDQVKPGLRAVIRVDAFAERTYNGSVKSVAVLPDQGGGWLGSDTKVYKTIVTIDEDVTQLKPGMTAVVEIDIEQLANVISVPIQAVVQRADKNWCYVRVDDQVVKREIVLGKTNDKFVEVKEGLAEGDAVVLNPTSLVEEQNAAATANKDKEKKKEEKKEKPDEQEPVKSPAPQAGEADAAAKPRAGAPEQPRDQSAEAQPAPAAGGAPGGAGAAASGGGSTGQEPAATTSRPEDTQSDRKPSSDSPTRPAAPAARPAPRPAEHQNR